MQKTHASVQKVWGVQIAHWLEPLSCGAGSRSLSNTHAHRVPKEWIVEVRMRIAPSSLFSLSLSLFPCVYAQVHVHHCSSVHHGWLLALVLSFLFVSFAALH